MRRWTPRRPSPELRQRIFGRPASVETAARTISDFSRFLVPAFGCFMLVLSGLSQRLPENLAATETNLLSGQDRGNSRIILAEARRLSEINAIPVTRMEYRIKASELAQPESTGVTAYTNQLIQQ